ncbi:MAG: DUF4864 domain-containing protein [Alphaproteobacteria bacterium]|nr:DUF4864 domain-containing protein [Alphaproteobacteria bacterium]
MRNPLKIGLLMAIMAVFSVVETVPADDMHRPNPSISAAEVVAIQLDALMRNDSPDADDGIRQTWAFAHPDNRKVTGPLGRFIEMMKTPAYEPLLNHRRHTITEQNRAREWVQFKVLMEDRGGRVLAFAWVVKKVKSGEYKDCWMTSAVSAPVLAGQGS